MILIDSIYINNSGGKILLDYLIEKLEDQDLRVTYLLDERVRNNHPIIKDSNKIVYLEANFRKRGKFYKLNMNSFSNVLCFANLPPNFRLNANVITYFHQQLYIKMPRENSILFKSKFFLKRVLLKSLLSNTDTWVMQSEEIKRNFSKRFNISDKIIQVLPFYPSLKKLKADKEKNSFVYISNAPAHKNHTRLINAFCAFYDKCKLGKLTVTIGKNFPDLLNLIQEKQNANYPIINLGFISREQVSKIYHESEYLIYPSLAESFGLGLIEAIEADCKIIAADLPYTYAVCEPSLTFNPFEEKSILEAFELSLQNIKPTIAKVSDKIDELIALFKYYENS